MKLYKFSNYDPDCEQFEAVIWERDTSRPLSIRERIRWCWKILTTGDPWADHTMFTKEQAKEIANYLNENS